MAKRWVADRKWHDIDFDHLPSWVKRRSRDLDRRQLVGQSFKYRRNSRTGKYQRKLRYHTPRPLVSTGRALTKALVLLSVLAATTIVVTMVCSLISGNINLTAGIIFSLIGISIIAWGAVSFSRRRLSFARTFMVVLISALFIIVSCAYLNIRSPTDVRDSVLSAFSTEEDQFRATVDAYIERTDLKVAEAGLTDKEITEESTSQQGATESQAAEPEATEEVSGTEHVYIKGGVLVGADGHMITLHNNRDATNPSWAELKAFLANDKTDKQLYNYSTFVCGDFAEMLHNNAEASGISAAFVTVILGPCSYYSTSGGHALNAFQTTDKGLVYIDCTSSLSANQGGNADKTVDVQVGKQYIPESIFPEPGWSVMWENMGVVEEIEIVQW